MKMRTMTRVLMLALVLSAGTVCAGSGDSFWGGFAGSATGSLVGGALSRSGSGSNRAEVEAARATAEAQAARRETDQMRMAQMQQQMMHRQGVPASQTNMTMMMGFLIILMVGGGLMAVMLFKKR